MTTPGERGEANVESLDRRGQLEARKSELLAQITEMQDAMAEIDVQLEDLGEVDESDSDTTAVAEIAPEVSFANPVVAEESLEERVASDQETLEATELLEALQDSLRAEEMHLSELRANETSISRALWENQNTLSNSSDYRDSNVRLVMRGPNPHLELVAETYTWNQSIEDLKMKIKEKEDAFLASNPRENSTRLFGISDPEMIDLNKQLEKLYSMPNKNGLEKSWDDERGLIIVPAPGGDSSNLEGVETLNQAFNKINSSLQEQLGSTRANVAASEQHIAELKSEIQKTQQ